MPTLCVSRDVYRNHNPKRQEELKALAESLGLTASIERVGLAMDLMISGPVAGLEQVLARIAQYRTFPYLVTVEPDVLTEDEKPAFDAMVQRYQRLIQDVSA